MIPSEQWLVDQLKLAWNYGCDLEGTAQHIRGNWAMMEQDEERKLGLLIGCMEEVIPLVR